MSKAGGETRNVYRIMVGKPLRKRPGEERDQMGFNSLEPTGSANRMLVTAALSEVKGLNCVQVQCRLLRNTC
jgi:hypothetical protein